jgi:hypothetical protein
MTNMDATKGNDTQTGATTPTAVNNSWHLTQSSIPSTNRFKQWQKARDVDFTVYPSLQ